jgi:hypothetical protein
MSRADLKERFAQAHGRVAKGARRVERQRRIVAQLEASDRNTDLAKRLLVHLETLQVLHVASRDRLLRDWGRHLDWNDGPRSTAFDESQAIARNRR